MVRLSALVSGLATLSLVSANVNLERSGNDESLPRTPLVITESSRPPEPDLATIGKRQSEAATPIPPKPPANTKTILYLHAAGGSIAWAVIMPIGAAVRKITSRARFHATIMAAGTLLAIVSSAAGIVFATREPKYSSFDSTHQILGLIILPLAVLQAPLGYYNHHVYLSSGRSTYFGTAHKYLGPALITVAILNGYLGIDLADDQEYIKPYVVTTVVWIFCLAMGAAVIRRWRRRGPEGLAAGVKAPLRDVVGGAEVGPQWAQEG